ncbi:hypothetical protein B0T13DRAFT_21081 [Neurospora crassa]|nr:hypothetical protein B0T13DRAFT_21081 [Neurospora crassa]
MRKSKSRWFPRWEASGPDREPTNHAHVNAECSLVLPQPFKRLLHIRRKDLNMDSTSRRLALSGRILVSIRTGVQISLLLFSLTLFLLTSHGTLPTERARALSLSLGLLLSFFSLFHSIFPLLGYNPTT